MNEQTPNELNELLKEVRRIQVASSRLVNGHMAGSFNSVFRGSGIEFDEVREYAEGDDPRSVDWNVTARMGRPFVKTYMDERELPILFLLDLSASMDTAMSTWTPRQAAARVCACLGLSAIKNNDKVGLIAFSDRVQQFVPFRSNLGHAMRIVRDCLALPSDTAYANPKHALEFAMGVFKRRAIVFLLSDFLFRQDAAPVTKAWTQTLSGFARQHDVVAVHIQAPELDHPTPSFLRIQNPISSSVSLVDWNHPRVRREFAERVQGWRRKVRSELRQARVDRIDLRLPKEPNGDLVATALLQFFYMRERRGQKR